jgi:hypothetical protein
MQPKRRNFLKNGSIALLSLAAPLRAGSAQAQPLPRLAEDDPLAQKLGYHHSSARVDRRKFANHRRGQDCDDCVHYKGKPREPWGPCDLFPGKSVNAKGWCLEFALKKKT